MKRVLLIAGGGTLGKYTAEELLQLGCAVEVICLEDMKSDNENLKFYKSYATYEFLSRLFEKNHYDGIINFVHYVSIEEYKKIHQLLIKNTNHLIFLSSYRVYADQEHPIRETSPMLVDVLKDEDFFANETYALPKTKAEQFLRTECTGQNWTIVRPVISFSHRRFDLFTHSGDFVIKCTRAGEPVLLPECAANLTAGLDWAGNSGKIIANLLFKENVMGEAYTISSAQNLKWDEVGKIYSDILGTKIRYISTEEYAKMYHSEKTSGYILWYDRMFDRIIDNTKVLSATGLKKEDFKSIGEGIEYEMKIYRDYH